MPSPHLALLGLSAFILGPSHVPAAEDVRIVRDVPYLAPERSEKLDLYLPAPTAEPAPAAIWIHGRRGDKGEIRGSEICRTLAQEGFVCVSINHGPDPDLASNLLDGKQAVRFLREHAEEYHLDPDRIAIMGGSMGGYYALLVGFTAGRGEFAPTGTAAVGRDHVRAVVDFYGPLGPPSLRVTDFVRPGGPPVLIIHGEDDDRVPISQSEELAAALAREGIEHEFRRVPGAGHGLRLRTTWDAKPLGTDLAPVLVAFLKKHLAPAKDSVPAATPAR